LDGWVFGAELALDSRLDAPGSDERQLWENAAIGATLSARRREDRPAWAVTGPRADVPGDVVYCADLRGVLAVLGVEVAG
jgi:hypothetical protein